MKMERGSRWVGRKKHEQEKYYIHYILTKAVQHPLQFILIYSVSIKVAIGFKKIIYTFSNVWIYKRIFCVTLSAYTRKVNMYALLYTKYLLDLFLYRQN